MVNRLYKLIALLFLLFCGFRASAKGGLYHYYHKTTKKTTVSATIPHHNPLLEFVINNIPAPVINVQQHRGAHSLQAFVATPGSYTIRFKHLDFTCGLDTSKLSQFRKLILFPFHDFW
ncbi:hypothetical protein SAMN05192574_10724 [Mucilaginibacter gossypiicola]|uniref:Uncharacterized protein n=1 Tax=Mucilaginibacter gossypiicola TaxID=551995 RepID=A0A1H8NNA1_9SPHI|nr:hypothetical protein SAMN05192574_10724 [Mucilaginibacter gossypiicola]